VRERSTGDGPVKSPPKAHAHAIHRPRRATIDRARRVEPNEQALVQRVPHAGLLPVTQSPPRRDPGAVAVLLGQVLPRDPRVQHMQDPVEHQPIGQWLAPRIAPPTPTNRDQRLDLGPPLVIDLEPGRHLHDPRSSTTPPTEFEIKESLTLFVKALLNGSAASSAITGVVGYDRDASRLVATIRGGGPGGIGDYPRSMGRSGRKMRGGWGLATGRAATGGLVVAGVRSVMGQRPARGSTCALRERPGRPSGDSHEHHSSIAPSFAPKAGWSRSTLASSSLAAGSAGTPSLPELLEGSRGPRRTRSRHCRTRRRGFGRGRAWDRARDDGAPRRCSSSADARAGAMPSNSTWDG
jgi:hypothetical protein